MPGEIEIGEWKHAPLHLFVPNTIYMVTAATLHKRHIFTTPEKLGLLQGTLFEVAESCGWELEAWAVFGNHYHVIARSPREGMSLKTVIQRLHSKSARLVNEMDKTPGRRVWFEYWDTCLTYENSYYARLNYVHYNPVKHGLVMVAEEYRFCSAGWFRAHAPDSFREKLAGVAYDRVNVPDVEC